MAVLGDPVRGKLVADLLSDASRERRDLPGVVKADIRATVNAIDTYYDGKLAEMNAVIPQPVRGAFTAREKAGLFALVLTERFKGTA